MKERERERDLGGQFLETYSDCNRARMPCLSVSVWGRSHCTGVIRCSPFLLTAAPSVFYLLSCSSASSAFITGSAPFTLSPLPFPTAACQAVSLQQCVVVCRRPGPPPLLLCLLHSAGVLQTAFLCLRRWPNLPCAACVPPTPPMLASRTEAASFPTFDPCEEAKNLCVQRHFHDQRM